MYKSGITRAQDLAKPLTVLGRTRPISFSLLRTSAFPSSAEIERFEYVIKTAGLSSGISKTTYAARLNDLDSRVLQLMKDTFHVDVQLEIHDMGASDAALSMKWAEQVFAIFPNARFTASDKVLYFIEAICEISGESYILEPNGTPIQYVRRPFVVWLPRPEHRGYVLNSLVRHWALQRVDDVTAWARNMRWCKFPDQSVIEHGGWRFRQIPLIHPGVLSALNERFKVLEMDAFVPSPLPFHVIRAMNLFQENVFSIDKLQVGLRSVLASLREGGLFILGKTVEREGARNDVSIFRKLAGGLTVISRLGMGSDIESLAVEHWT